MKHPATRMRIYNEVEAIVKCDYKMASHFTEITAEDLDLVVVTSNPLTHTCVGSSYVHVA